MRFKRVTAEFDDVAKARFCESSGGEQSLVESVTDLYGLVNSFIERGNGFRGGRNEEEIINDDKEKEENGLSNNYFDDLEIKEKLRNLLGYEESDYVKRNIHSVVENAWLEIGDRSTAEFKRRLTTRLRDREFDVGLCKSKWERNGQIPSGNYEYIDLNMKENRYIIEVYLAREFEIARPTPYYTSLLEIFPSIFVGKVEELKQVVKLMSRATKKSMKKMDIHVPPWRQLNYMQAKWFGSYYKRTINEFLLHDDNKNLDFSYKCLASIRFCVHPNNCRENFASNNGIKVGNLAAALKMDEVCSI